MADRAPVGTEFQSDCQLEVQMQVHICSGVGYLELKIVPPGAVASGLEQTCSRVYINKTIHDFVLHADLV